MRLSTKGQYAVRAMVRLACHDCGGGPEGDKPVSLKEISKEEGISLSYLEQLFVKLRRGELVRSVRGPGGGYILKSPAANISVGEVIRVVEEPLNPVACLDADSNTCEKSESCITQKVWKRLGDKIKEFLDSVSIEDLALEVSALNKDTGEATEGVLEEDHVCRPT